MILSAQSIRARREMIEPFFERTENSYGLTYGLGPAGYDIRLAGDLWIPDGGFRLGSSIEHFNMPDDLIGIVHDKSTWARRGIAVQNTVIEPGWRGYLTLEISNHNSDPTYGQILLSAGQPICQVIFHTLDVPTESPYDGKYQDQAPGPQPAR